MTRAPPLALVCAGAVLSLSAAAFAQMPQPQQPLQAPLPQEQTMSPTLDNAPEGQPACQPYAPGRQTQIDVPTYGASSAMIPGTDQVPRDRLGNVVRGNSCSDSWANCAYDPSSPMPGAQPR